MAEPAQDYSKLKVPDLKELLKQANLPVSGNKAQLIERLQQAAAAQPEGAQPDEGEQEANGASSPVDLPAQAEHGAAVTGKRHAEERTGEDTGASGAKRPRVDDDDAVMTTSAPSPPAEAPPPELAPTSAAPAPAAAPSVEEPAPARSVAPPAIEEQLVPHEELVAKAQGETEQDQQQQDPEEEEEPPEYIFEPEEETGRPTDMYLDTINRHALDFDFERLCSVTLSHNNIYACLVDGKYFQGRGKSSPAYAHSIGEDHHVFLNLETQKVFVLPDGYEVSDPSLDDIKHLLYPTFTPSLLQKIDSTLHTSYTLSQTPYYPGFVGLNNIKANSYMNAILHSLLHVIPLRDYFILDPAASSPHASELVKRFGMLCRKVWNPKAFKGQVSPHELLQEVSNASGGRFKITEAGDPIEFLGWLLNQLHRDLGGTKKPKSSIIYSAFQGEVRIDDQQVLKIGEYGSKPKFDVDREIKSTVTPFLFLALDLPPPPLFQDAVESNIIPQVPISTVLAKYNGARTQESGGVLRRFKITRLPPFLIFHIKRFTSNRFLEEKNPTIVNFPLRGVDMSDYVDASQPLSTYYDLVSNITHSSLSGTAKDETQWKTHVHLRPERDDKGNLKAGVKDEDDKWFEVQDLNVEEIQKGMVSLGESYIQIWERRTPNGRHDLQVDPPKPKKKGLAATASSKEARKEGAAGAAGAAGKK
ncbi:hypothetical protein JCM1841_001402 [Sporobolomyces salmonicolor]